MMKQTDADYWIKHLELIPHPEGGFYRELFRSEEEIAQSNLPERYSGARKFYTSIYFLLKYGQVSHFHRIKSDEIWSFHNGSSLDIHIIDPKGNYSIKKLGLNFENNEMPQQIVNSGCWFGASIPVENCYSLVSCFVAPGFDFSDFELAKREDLLELYSSHINIISKLTH